MATKAGRHRVDTPALVQLKSWDDLDRATREVGEEDIRIANIKAKLTRQVNELKEAAEVAARPHVENRGMLLRQIQEFAEAHRKDLGERKSRELNFGVIGWRQSTSLAIARVKDTLAKLKGLGMHDCVRTKEEIDKDALRGYGDEALAKVGVRRKVTDDFFVEPNLERIHVAEG